MISIKPNIQTERIHLRLSDETDSGLFLELSRRKEVRDYIGISEAVSGLPKDNFFVIVYKERPVGIIGFVKSPALEGKDYELLCALIHDAEGIGLAAEACQAAVEWAFKTKNWPRILGCVVSDNTRSKKLVKRLGLKCLEERPFGQGTVYILEPVKSG